MVNTILMPEYRSDGSDGKCVRSCRAHLQEAQIAVKAAWLQIDLEYIMKKQIETAKLAAEYQIRADAIRTELFMLRGMAISYPVTKK